MANSNRRQTLLFLFSLFSICSYCSADIIVHVLHPWAADTVRSKTPFYIRVNGSHPGAPLEKEGMNWFTYTIKGNERNSSSKFWFTSVIPDQYYAYSKDSSTKELMISDVFSSDSTNSTEVWITYSTPYSNPTFSFTPPPGHPVICFFNPWTLGAPRTLVENLGYLKMKSIPGICKWFRLTLYVDKDSARVKFMNSIDSSFYSASGKESGDFIDLKQQFSTSDTVWIIPSPYPDGPPSISGKFPDFFGSCDSITLAAKLRDKGNQPDFSGDCPIELTKGMVEKNLGSDGKPVRTISSCASDSFNIWFVAESLGNGYTNEQCHNITLHTNEEGLYEYSTNLFFPLDNFKFLDAASTLPNPYYTAGGGEDGKEHNFHFTMELGAEFKYVRGQTFYFRGDDDVWVFINNKLVVDLGGIHGPLEESVNLDTLGLKPDSTYAFKLFYSERRCCGSNFRMVTSINLRTKSNFFYRESSPSENIIQFDMYEKVTQNNLSCDYIDAGDTSITLDTIKAATQYFISGPSFNSKLLMATGTSYGGITISSDYSTIIIDKSNLEGLAAGDYLITFLSINNSSQGGQIPFTIDAITKPPRITNPVIAAAYYADNGIGQADRAEIYFQNDLKFLPDSVMLQWPSILNRRIIYRDQIIADSGNKKHITIKLNVPFEKEVTTYLGNNRLGYSYTYDTSFTTPLETVQIRFADSIGPLIMNATVLERVGIGFDTLLLKFSEEVVTTSLIGQSIVLHKADTTILLSILTAVPRADTIMVTLNSNQSFSFESGDSLSINSSGPLTDVYQNHAHKNNRPIQITIRKFSGNMMHAFYRDQNADGIVDMAQIEFDRPVDLSGITCSFSWINGGDSKLLGNEQIRYGSTKSTLIIDLSNAFTKDISKITSGSMDVSIQFEQFNTDPPKVAPVIDSAAPVLVSAVFQQGMLNMDGNSQKDTLSIVFSEDISPISFKDPFIFKRGSQIYEMVLNNLSVQGKKHTFIVDSYTVINFPEKTDSVFIKPNRISDLLKNTQENPLNARVLLQVKTIPVHFIIKVGPNPFDPVTQMIYFVIDPTAKIKDIISIQGEVIIYDPVGNIVHSDNMSSKTSPTPELKISWNGHNRYGRKVGKGTYLAIVKASDLNSQKTEMKKFFIGVK